MNDHNKTERKIFLSKASLFLEQGLYQAALDLADSRSDRLPEDVDAKIIRCRALVGLGSLDKAKDLLAEMEDTIHSLSKMFECMGDFSRKTDVMKEADIFRSELMPTSSNKSGCASRKTVADSDNESSALQIGANFYTMTLAELYIKQSHLKAASDILKKIIKNDSNNQKAAKRLEEIEQILNAKTGKKALLPQKQRRLIDELMRWLKNIDRVRNYAA
jgi:thioredoxin-like negative regulator of GroEL